MRGRVLHPPRAFFPFVPSGLPGARKGQGFLRNERVHDLGNPCPFSRALYTVIKRNNDQIWNGFSVLSKLKEGRLRLGKPWIAARIPRKV